MTEDFSTISTDSPLSWAASAAAMPVPEPMTSKSTVVSRTGRPVGIVEEYAVVTGQNVGQLTAAATPLSR